VRRPGRQLHRVSRIALLLALGSGLSQGASVVAGYVTGLEGRLIAVFCLVIATSLLAASPVIMDEIKKISIPNIPTTPTAGPLGCPGFG
jgi:hypothetical protein